MSTETQKAANKWWQNLSENEKHRRSVVYKWSGLISSDLILEKYLAEHSQPAEQYQTDFGNCPICKDILMAQVNSPNRNCVTCGNTVVQPANQTSTPIKIVKEKLKCNHPKEFQDSYHDDSIICNQCHEVIEQFGEPTGNEGYYYVEVETSIPIRKPLENIKGSATYIGEPSPELENAVNQMAESAYESASTPMEEDAPGYPITEAVFFQLRDGKYLCSNGVEVETLELIKNEHYIFSNFGYMILNRK